MSDRKWACRIRCDWIGCTTETEAVLDSQESKRELPEGWTDLMLKFLFIGDYTDQKKEFCPEHSQCTIADLAAAPWHDLRGTSA
jgi:hypothetical protein